MTQPAERNQKYKIYKTIKKQSWLLFITIVVVILIDTFLFKATETSNLVFAKSFSIGALINFMGQASMVGLLSSRTGYHARKSIVNRLYLGELCRWVITIVGFFIAFNYIKPLQPMIMFLGYILIQVSYFIFLMQLK